jgi:hypothetical protein
MRRVAGISGWSICLVGGGSSLDFLDFLWIFGIFGIFLEDLEEFCNVERRLEGGGGLAPGFFGK